MKNLLYRLNIFFCLISFFCKVKETELPIVVLVCSYNVGPWVTQNLDSICNQNYKNFHVLYIDDASKDDTVQLVSNYIQKYNLTNKITFIANPSRCRKMKNIYNAFHMIDDESIIVQVDGDDWLAHENVLSSINQMYKTHNVWLTYGQYTNFPSETLGLCKPLAHSSIQNNSFRESPWIFSHLKTFYAWLAKLIKLEDVLAKDIIGFLGKFYPASNDVATMYPMLEMAQTHIKFIPDILYIYNQSNPNLGKIKDKTTQHTSYKEIKKRPRYSALPHPKPYRLDAYVRCKADCLIFSQTPDLMKQLLLSLSQWVKNIMQITVLYEDTPTSTLYNELEKQFPSINFINISTQSEIAKTITRAINSFTNEHILFIRDTIYIKGILDMTKCIQELEKTFAHAFYFSFEANEAPFFNKSTQREHIPYQHVWDDIYAWKFNCGPKKLCNTLDMTLLRKKDFLNQLTKLPIQAQVTITSFLKEWEEQSYVSPKKVGLFLHHPNISGINYACLPFTTNKTKRRRFLKKILL